MSERNITPSGIEEQMKAAQSSKDKSRPEELKLLSDSLRRAVNSLSDNFSYNNPFAPTGDDAADYYKMFESVAETFANLGRELLTMRSSYLPFEMYENALADMEASAPGAGETKKISEIIDADAILESYENTFFRLLGMPSTGDITDKSLVTVTPTGKYVERDKDNQFELTSRVLEKRAQTITDRLEWPTSTAYDFLSGTTSSFDRLTDVGFKKIEELSAILVKIRELSAVEKPDENSAKLASSLYSLMEENRGVDLQEAKYQIQEASQLPVVFGPSPGPQQSGTGAGSTFLPQSSTAANQASAAYFLTRMLDISLAWLEPKVANKITLHMKKHLYNEHVAKVPDATMMNIHDPTNFWQYSYLLFPPVQDERIATCINEPSKMVAEPFLPESMRTINGHKLKSTLLEAVIRIRLDIVSGFPQKAARVSETGMAIATEGDERPINKDEMGLLESLLIVRLFSALNGFAQDCRKKVKVAHAEQHRAGRSPSGQPPPDSDHVPAPKAEKVKSPDQLKLEALLLAEESLLLLFGDSSPSGGALSSQEGVARNAGVKKAHLMGAALSVLDVPKRFASKKLGEISEVKDRGAEKPAAQATGQLRERLGMAKGVGSLDLLVYLIALFTAKEKVLLALLNPRQFEYLKAEYPDGFFDNFDLNSNKTGIEDVTRGKAVSKIAERAFDAYQLFRFMIKNDQVTFRYPTVSDWQG